MSLPQFEYHQPDTLPGVIEALVRFGSDAAPLAGGTALLIDMQHGELAPLHVVSLWGVTGLREVIFDDPIEIGALATITRLGEAIRTRPELSGLREAAGLVGARQIQNMATVGGNLCKASPGADLVPPLLVLDAGLALSGAGGDRRVPLDGFLIGPDQTALLPAEVLTAVLVPRPPGRTGTAFAKVMRRKAVDCSIVSVAARITLSPDGQTCSQARIAIAAAAPNPFRARRAEQALEGGRIGTERAKEAGRIAQEESNPIDDVRASAEYRRWLVESLVERAVLAAADRAEAS